MKTWNDVMQYCIKTYGTYVDYEERFFLCPECGEPIYECDWEGDNNLSEGICPICETLLVED
jgi:hypothetical protein